MISSNKNTTKIELDNAQKRTLINVLTNAYCESEDILDMTRMRDVLNQLGVKDINKKRIETNNYKAAAKNEFDNVMTVITESEV